MQTFTRIEIEWTAQELAKIAEQMKRAAGMEAATDIERGLLALRSEQYQSIAEKFATAAANGDKRIAIQ